MLPRLAVTPLRLDPAALSDAVVAAAGSRVGAVASFVGLVRAENAGRRVRHLDYESYDLLAVRCFELIEREVAGQWSDVVLGVHHRTGRLALGDASVAIVAASPHRADAFAACRYAIERVKQIAPVWKHEHFEGGDVWIEGAVADPGDEAARAAALKIACG